MKKDIVGKIYWEVFPKNQQTPGYYRKLLVRYDDALQRLAENSYAAPRLKSHDEKFVGKILNDIKNIRYYASIKINTRSVIIEAPS